MRIVRQSPAALPCKPKNKSWFIAPESNPTRSVEGRDYAKHCAMSSISQATERSKKHSYSRQSHKSQPTVAIHPVPHNKPFCSPQIAAITATLSRTQTIHWAGPIAHALSATRTLANFSRTSGASERWCIAAAAISNDVIGLQPLQL